jgi:hypothetical protein
MFPYPLLLSGRQGAEPVNPRKAPFVDASPEGALPFRKAAVVSGLTLNGDTFVTSTERSSP